MPQLTRALLDRPSETSEDGLEWVPQEIAETPPEPPLFRRFAPSKQPAAEQPATNRPTAKAQPATRVQGDGIVAEVARRLELAEESIAESRQAVERSTLALAQLLESGDGRKS